MANLKRETESLWIIGQIRTNYFKEKIDITQWKSKCRFCDDKNETVHYIKTELSKLAQKQYKSSHDWVEKVIDRELYMRLKVDHTTKWYLHKQESVQ